MTTLKFFLPLVLTVFALLSVTFIANAQKKQLSITSTTIINASEEAVFDLLRHLDRYPEWSPFLVDDPTQKYHITGVAGQLGSAYHWEGGSEKSKGKQTMTVADANRFIRMECDLEKPFKGNPIFEYHLKAIEGGVEVVQEFTLPLSRFSNFMIKLFGVKKQMIASNQLGLDRLKALLEVENELTSQN